MTALAQGFVRCIAQFPPLSARSGGRRGPARLAPGALDGDSLGFYSATITKRFRLHTRPARAGRRRAPLYSITSSLAERDDRTPTTNAGFELFAPASPCHCARAEGDEPVVPGRPADDNASVAAHSSGSASTRIKTTKGGVCIEKLKD